MKYLLTIVVILFISACNQNPATDSEPIVTARIIEGRYQMINHHGPLDIYIKPDYYVQTHTHSIYGFETMIIGHYKFINDTLNLIPDFHGRVPQTEEHEENYFNDFKFHELRDQKIFAEKVSIEIDEHDTVLVIYEIDGNQWILNKY